MIDQLRAAAFAGPLADAIRHCLTAEGSLGQAIFGRRGLVRLLDEHGRGQRDHLSTVGTLLTAERWRCMAQETSRMAASAERA